jgi:hypothetical protein
LGEALTLGRKVHPARERILLNIVTAKSTVGNALKKYHSSRQIL